MGGEASGAPSGIATPVPPNRRAAGVGELLASVSALQHRVVIGRHGTGSVPQGRARDGTRLRLQRASGPHAMVSVLPGGAHAAMTLRLQRASGRHGMVSVPPGRPPGGTLPR